MRSCKTAAKYEAAQQLERQEKSHDIKDENDEI